MRHPPARRLPDGNERMMNRKFPWPDFLRRLAVIAVPVAMQNLLTSTGSMIDTMMIGALGETSVGAVGLCAQFSSLMFSGYWGFVGGGMLFYSQYWGAKDDDGINRSYGLTLTFMMAVGIAFGLVATVFPETVMNLYTDKEVFRPIGVDYLRIAGFAYPLTTFSKAMAALLRSTERVKVPLYGAVAGVTTNILFNWLLIKGHAGFPAMGVRGAALATVIAAAVNVTVILICVAARKHPYVLDIRRHFRWNGRFVRTYLVKCAPILANEILIGVGNMLINVVLGRQSEEAVAATAVFRTLEGLVIGFFAGFSNAASVLVGKEVGAGNHEVAWQRAIRLIYLCMAFIAFLGVTLIALHTPILRSMGLSGESLSIGFGMICVYAAAAVIRMGNWTHNDTFRAAGDAAYGTILEIAFMFLMVIPLVWLSGMVWHWPFLLIFACCYADEPIRFVLMQRHLYGGKWIQPVTPEGRDALPAFRAAHGFAAPKE